jgi:hypothetical protein
MTSCASPRGRKQASPEAIAGRRRGLETSPATPRSKKLNSPASAQSTLRCLWQSGSSHSGEAQDVGHARADVANRCHQTGVCVY